MGRGIMDIKIKIGNEEFKNPIWTASGTFGYGKEFEDFFDIEKIGAIITKTVTVNAREGNAPPRVVETPSGLLNSIGLENKGADKFREENYPYLKKLKTKIIISIAGNNEKEFEQCIEKLSEKHFPNAFEINLSCPNVDHLGARYRLIAQDPRATEKIVKSVKKRSQQIVIAKLTPNVTDIAEIASAAENGGADAVSLVNTYMGIAVDAQEQTPVLGNIIGGLSGPAIKPMALKAVRDAYQKIKIPIIGIGGIMRGMDVVEFMLCGAKAVQVGTANFVNPDGYNLILKEFKDYLKRKNIKKLNSIIGKIGNQSVGTGPRACP
ncbi:MAG: dihydroorotate dehydrogenase [Candidatus Omnitrophota bacterium]